MDIHFVVFTMTIHSLKYVLPTLKGLVNTGNDCYFNAAIQCLVHIPVLTNHMFQTTFTDGFAHLYSAFVFAYWSDTIPGPLTTLPLQDAFPQFKSNEQHDVQEMILCLIDTLERQVPELKQWVYGLKRQETVWPGGSSINEEVFSIHLVSSDGGTSMANMLLKSTDWNTLDSYENHSIAVTRMVFSKLPPVLMISFDTKSHIEIIERINIDGHEYTLISCVIHTGTQNDGHYVSFVNHDGNWFLINDHHVQAHALPPEAGYYFMVYNLKTPT